jgi:hypothetical protein
MSLIGGLLGDASTAVSGFSIGTWIKIGTGVAVVLVVGGLYWWGAHEASLVSARDQTIGQQSQVLADNEKTIKNYKGAVNNWKSAFNQLQTDYQSQQSARIGAEEERDRLNEDVIHIRALLRSSPALAADQLNRNALESVCLLVHASGGQLDGCPGTTSGTLSVTAPGAD